MQERILIYDGVCNLCNASVRFILKHDKKMRIQFISYQSDELNKYVPDDFHGFQAIRSVAYIRNGRIYAKSYAVLMVLWDLGAWFRLTSVFFLVPPFLLNPVYRLIASNRYRWFGRTDSCQVIPEIWKDRFLD
ncbi:MAG: DUF393 domain-containing protein [Bacteroidetes bacterium]|nr:DUF393 domain-containing protein [Bacteroidota bacterium]